MSSCAVRDPVIFALDRPVVLLSGDLALRRAVARAYGLDHLPTRGRDGRPGGALATVIVMANSRGPGSLVVIDATNDFDPSDLNGWTSSQVLADLVPGARVVNLIQLPQAT